MRRISQYLLYLFYFLLFYGCRNHVSEHRHDFNFDFENHEKGFPTNWEHRGSDIYEIYIDSTNSKRGKYSAIIENTVFDSGYHGLSFVLPENYKGDTILLSGYIKTENIESGYAGLMMRIYPSVAFDNMYDRGIKGTTDWQKYEIALPLNPLNTQKIEIGGLLVGKGKMWLDDLHISIDGKELGDQSIEVRHTKYDDEFDQGSKVEFPPLDTRTLTNLELLGRVWGMLKYHHPVIVTGEYNWDYELFRLLPRYLRVKNDKERDDLLETWIDQYGNIPPCETCESTPLDAKLKPDLSWIEEVSLSQKLRSKLTYIYMNRNQGPNNYVSLYPQIFNPVFANENRYIEISNPDAGFRLLSLYRYWNIIEYFFPYKHLTDKKWSSVLQEYIPEFVLAKNELEYEIATLKLIGEINDSHAGLWEGADKLNELRGNNFVPFEVEFIENRLVVTDDFNPAFLEATKLEIGDEITHINNRAVNTIVDSLKPYYPAANESAKLRNISRDILRSPEKNVFLTYISNGRHKTGLIPLLSREKLSIGMKTRLSSTEKSYKILDGNIGYIDLGTIKSYEIPEIVKTFKNSKGIVIDIRNYPSTFVPFSLGGYFVSTPTTFAEFTRGNIHNPGEFTFRRGQAITPNYRGRLSGKLIVLVNEKSQSQAEYTAMAFRAAENSVIIGSETAGSDGNVSTIYLPGNLKTMISGIGVYYPDGTETQRLGIVPDVVVKPTIKGIRQGKDEVLDKAIDIINQ